MLQRLLFYLSVILLLYGCNNSKGNTTNSSKNNTLTTYVNPFIGTGAHGHTYPGATMPFGMMQLSPDTRLDGWDGCSGYHYSDNYIYGFSHTHLSGTGVSDYGDILLMPTHEVNFNNGANGKKGYKAPFSHKNEIAKPGFYSVYLDSTEIDVALTVSERSGIHQYTFKKGTKQVVILDLEHRDKVLDSKIETISKQEIQGYRHSKAWAEDQRLFYNISFSKPFTKVTYLNNVSQGEKVKAAFEFDNNSNNILEVRIGISAVNEAGAKENSVTELGTKTFDEVKTIANDTWNKQLNKVTISTDNEDQKVIFYTALYHTMLAPNIYQDVSGNYRGMDLKIHQNTSHTNYTVFSLWDTYRATHPLYTILETERTNDFINTFIAKYNEGGIMPIWDLSGNYTGCMIGYHAVPVIADAYLKGIKDYDTEKAFEAMKHSANQDHLGLSHYKKLQYIPVEAEAESVSKTLEYAYDDWTIAQMAQAMGKTADYNTYIKRAQYYKNVFDPSTKFMRGRIRNTWFAPFDPYEVNFNYTEANSWQYSFYAPQDISGFIDLLGGKAALEHQLDALFTAKDQTSGRNQVDITGLIGQYAHGNEPSHHIAYLYNFINKPHKTQQYVNEILNTLYQNNPEGISGNEDCGQMSAWYVFSALGFYPVTPGANTYIIGTPLFETAEINLENEKTFKITSERNQPNDIYIEHAYLNGKPLNRSYLYHNEIMAGGELHFKMSNTPTTWGTKDSELPVTKIADAKITPAPFIKSGDIAFKEKTQVVLANVDTLATIFYKYNNDDFKTYSQPIIIDEKGQLEVYAEKNSVKSATITTDFFEIDPNVSISLAATYANQYNGGGDNALIDGIKGGNDFRAGAWQGYFNTNVDATINLGPNKRGSEVSIRFLQDQRSWIFFPKEVYIKVSEDGKTFKKLPAKTLAVTPSEATEIKAFTFNIPKTTQYIKIHATTLGDLPEWHLGYAHDGKSWVFIDEVSIN